MTKAGDYSMLMCRSGVGYWSTTAFMKGFIYLIWAEIEDFINSRKR